MTCQGFSKDSQRARMFSKYQSANLPLHILKQDCRSSLALYPRMYSLGRAHGLRHESGLLEGNNSSFQILQSVSGNRLLVSSGMGCGRTPEVILERKSRPPPPTLFTVVRPCPQFLLITDLAIALPNPGPAVVPLRCLPAPVKRRVSAFLRSQYLLSGVLDSQSF